MFGRKNNSENIELIKSNARLETENKLLAEQLSNAALQSQQLNVSLSEASRENQRLQYDIDRLKTEIDYRNKSSASHREDDEKKRIASEKKKIDEKNIEKSILSAPQEYFQLKQSFFSDSEQSVFYALSRLFSFGLPSSVHEVFGCKIVAFPHVGLGEFIEAKPDKNNRTDHIHKILKKHVDFLLCEYAEKPIYKYVPRAVIEVNGSDHSTNPARLQSDQLKTALFNGLGLPFITITNDEVRANKLQPFLSQKFADVTRKSQA